ncbi:unnamed protein product [Prorocentrum cordatum]|uniref:P-type ATPase N-terminal domain-containing protein n=1 Tax=Prorocentrum cordatum TaxID=2364126 RepID=A0ABN9Q932_9DINO|nr:unnamed protein product [Polarella glacialis]
MAEEMRPAVRESCAQAGLYCSQLVLHLFFLLSMYLWNVDMLKVYSVFVTLLFFLVLCLAMRSLLDVAACVLCLPAVGRRPALACVPGVEVKKHNPGIVSCGGPPCSRARAPRGMGPPARAAAAAPARHPGAVFWVVRGGALSAALPRGRDGVGPLPVPERGPPVEAERAWASPAGGGPGAPRGARWLRGPRSGSEGFSGAVGSAHEQARLLMLRGLRSGSEGFSGCRRQRGASVAECTPMVPTERDALSSTIRMLVPDPSRRNRITTAKYTWYTFVPKNLFEQLTQLANAYFLLIALLQVIPEISNTGGYPLTLIPLSFVLVMGAIKDGFEDWRRHVSDRSENEGEAVAMDEGQRERPVVHTFRHPTFFVHCIILMPLTEMS